MTALTSPDARCIGCKRPVRKDQTRCACGDPVRIMTKEERRDVKKPRLELIEGSRHRVPPSHIDPSGAQEHVDEIMGHPRLNKGPALSDEQTAALGKIRDWYTSEPLANRGVFRLFGAAGTGKTTLAKHLASALGADIVYGAYTGKAAHVLRSKGVPATTIHSAIYHPVDNSAARARHREMTTQIADLENDLVKDSDEILSGGTLADLKQELAQLEDAIRFGVEFELNPHSEWADADLIVLDEVSMVNEALALDIESFGVPVLVLGDPHQLPPVDGGGYYTNVRPDVLLNEVHRFYLGSPVGRLATAIRNGDEIRGQHVRVNIEEAMAADQVLCWKNSTRHALTAEMRKRRGRPAGRPVAGDRVMCLVNNKDIGIFNGQQFEVMETGEGESFLLREVDEGTERWLAYDPDGFRGQEGEQEAKGRRRFRGKVGLFTFADVITVHKAQGSEWPSVYVVDQTHQMSRSTAADKRRWAYTAVTRASQKVTLASTEVK